jgi:Na+-transporting methylmalonyl-CoA/oxaloacetate decarboxylase gamma subunit
LTFLDPPFFSAMNPLQFSTQNIIDGQGIPIAITGMLIVFCVLALITLFIEVLPKLTALLERYVPEDDHPSILAAIAFVAHLRRQ